MRTTPATSAEVDTWLTVLRRHGYLHRAEPGPDGSWSVQRSPQDARWTLHHPVLAMDYVEHVLREVRRGEPKASR